MTETFTQQHNDITKSLAKKEAAQHFEGNAMQELYKEMRTRPLKVKATRLSEEELKKAPIEKILSNVNNESNSTDNKVTKIVHFIRHGQGFHNLMADMYHGAGKSWEQFVVSDSNPYIIPEILDAPLTEKGRQQAAALQPIVKELAHQPELVVLSPNCRAIQTGLIVFHHLIDNPNDDNNAAVVEFVAHEMVREETGVHICDARRPTSHQKREFPHVNFDLLEHEDDLIFNKQRRETKQEIGNRIYKFCEFLFERKERVVGVASHSGWLMTAFNAIFEIQSGGEDDEDDDAMYLKEWFQTGEMRSVKLEFEMMRL